MLVFLFAASCVRGKRVIRAAERSEKTGYYIVKLHNETSHEIFEQTLQKALKFSEVETVYAKHEGVFKFFTVKLSEKALDEVLYGACSAYIGYLSVRYFNMFVCMCR